jgi:hypothetical protein
VPPFGGPTDRVLVDWRLTGCEWLVFEAGMHEESIRLRTEDLLRVADAALADLVIVSRRGRRVRRGQANGSPRGPSCEHVFVMYADALLLLFELADREDERFQHAAARWHARFVLEARLSLREAEGVMALLCRVRGADRLVVRRRLLLSVERAGLATKEIRPGA